MVLPDETYGYDLIQNGLCLSEIPDFQGLLPKSLDAGVPVFVLDVDEIHETGTVLEGMLANRDKFNTFFDELAGEIKRLTE
ncbi:MAG: hypothetical protein D3916_17285 [Candidatus Electrothrix sp. MAN1_4]|nr:hypothetical protein [Candidatus Electrothrix sp. MAN1_4]